MSSRLFWSATVLVCLSAPAHAGFIEICKNSDPFGSLSGDPFFFFTIATVAGQPELGPTLVPVDSCTPSPPDPTAILLPDGDYVISEVPDPTSVLESVSTFPDYALISFDLQAGSATVLSTGGTDPEQELTVYFNNTPVTATPEPGTGWLLGLGLTVWALRGNPTKRRQCYTAFRNATNSAVRRAFD